MDENKTFNISMPKALLDAIDKQAETEFRNRSDLIREAVRSYIAQKGGMSTADKLTKSEEGRIKSSFDFADFSSQPAIAVSCTYRPQPNSVQDIFTADSAAMKLIEHPPRIRRMGWDLDTLDRARPIAGDYLQVANGKRKLLRLYRDGQHTFSAGMDFFGHGVNENHKSPINLNLLSVAELITNFVTFSISISETLKLGSDKAIFTIAVSSPPHGQSQKEKTAKRLGLHAYDGFGTTLIGELDLEWAERNVIVKNEDKMTAEQIAYLIYAELCYFFGVRGDEIWYVNKEKREINISAFTRSGR